MNYLNDSSGNEKDNLVLHFNYYKFLLIFNDTKTLAPLFKMC